MLSDVLMWSKWVHKHCKRSQKTFQLGKILYMISWFYKQNIFYSDFEDNDFDCTGKFCYWHGNFQNQKQPLEVFLKFNVSQNSWENTYARVSFLIKLQGSGLQFYLKNILRNRCFPVNFVKFLRIPFWKANVSQNMRAFKFQVPRN